MIKRILCIIFELIIIVVSAVMPFYWVPITIIASSILICELIFIVHYYNCEMPKVLLSYRELMKYIHIDPDRYYYPSFERVNYTNKNNEIRQIPGRFIESSIHTVIFFTTYWSSIRFLLYFLSVKISEKKKKNNKYMIRYLNSVDHDIEVFKQNTRKEIDEALKTQQNHMIKMGGKQID